MNDLNEILALDETLVAVARNVKVLSALGWDPSISARFLENLAGGNPRLPEVEYAHVDLGREARALDRIARQAENLDHPLGRFVSKTALSYLNITQMLEHRGDSRMTELSIAEYGQPGEPLSGGRGSTSLDAANYFLAVSRDFADARRLGETDLRLSAQSVKADLDARLPEVFGGAAVSVRIDPRLTAKAAAGATGIRLRDATCFSAYDVEQLLQHEAFVHTLTALNGRRQPRLRSMSLGAPRTTATQEGLATFAELVTGAIDLARLERIALRIIGIDMALGGADFLEVFRFFTNAGQPESESVNSTVRIFRGAPVSGGCAFTKDSVYLHGLLEVHTFFRWALRHHRLDLCVQLFAGRMTLGDVVRLSPLFEDETLLAPRYLPPWMTRTTGLAGYLAFAVFGDAIVLDELDAEHVFETLDR